MGPVSTRGARAAEPRGAEARGSGSRGAGNRGAGTDSEGQPSRTVGVSLARAATPPDTPPSGPAGRRGRWGVGRGRRASTRTTSTRTTPTRTTLHQRGPTTPTPTTPIPAIPMPRAPIATPMSATSTVQARVMARPALGRDRAARRTTTGAIRSGSRRLSKTLAGPADTDRDRRCRTGCGGDRGRRLVPPRPSRIDRGRRCATGRTDQHGVSGGRADGGGRQRPAQRDGDCGRHPAVTGSPGRAHRYPARRRRSAADASTSRVSGSRSRHRRRRCCCRPWGSCRPRAAARSSRKPTPVS